MQVAVLREELGKLEGAVDKYVIDHSEPGGGYEDDTVRLTKVVSYRRTWNPDTLRKLLPTALYKLVIEVKVDATKLNELVSEGKIDRKKIEAAYEETANAPYVKRTAKSDDKTSKDEAAKLSKALG